MSSESIADAAEASRKIRFELDNLRASIEARDEQLSHARGALSEIREIVTGCVPVGVEGQFKRICEAVLDRILSSAHQPMAPPRWYRHEWEKQLWEKYLSGEIKACASPEESSLAQAKRLAGGA